MKDPAKDQLAEEMYHHLLPNLADYVEKYARENQRNSHN